jgi:uncharacterized membrane protein
MKIFISIVAALVLWVSSIGAAEVPYTFQTVDIPRPDSGITWPQDINNKGELIASIFANNLEQGLVATPMNRRFTAKKGGSLFESVTPFTCGEASSITSINNKGQISGSCFFNDREHGYVRNSDGSLVFLDPPGAFSTIAWTVANDGNVAGSFASDLIPGKSGLFRFHCFFWNAKNNRYRIIDFPRENTYVHCPTVNKRGQVLGEYHTFNPDTNETIEHGWFIYDNGNFDINFPLSFEEFGGPGFYFADINDDGQMIGVQWNIGPQPKLSLYDDGVFYDIRTPEGWVAITVEGMNNRGQFVGSYFIQVGFDDFFQTPIYKLHGYVATPLE